MKIIQAITNTEIRARIIKRSSELGISQIELASLLNISIEDFIAIEMDMLSQYVDVIMDLCKIFKCTADYLLCYSNDPKKTGDMQ